MRISVHTAIWTIVAIGVLLGLTAATQGTAGIKSPPGDSDLLAFFLPALAMFAMAWGDQAAAAIGVFWPLGRVMYGLGYAKAPEKRGPGFGLSFLSASILLLGALAGAVMSLA